MARPNIVKRRHTELLQLESVARITNLPIVESGISIAGNVYRRIKHSNSLIDWGLDTAESSLASAVATATATALPAIIVLNGPIMTIDHLLCKGIDMMEQRVPAIHLHPHLMYWNTREYVNNKFVKPVLIRADSVKLIGSQAANAAVDRLNGAIDVADQYVDRYLPADPADKTAEAADCTDSAKPEETSNKAVRTIEHGARFSRKLQRRLTRRTLAEARALKEQGTECIHVLLYVVELIATDPKLAWQKAKELWASLSLPEPENQARPTNLEQLLVLFTRETARRVVHLVNGTANLASRAPRRVARALARLYHRLVAITEQALKVTARSLYGVLVDVLSATSAYRQHLIAADRYRQCSDHRPKRKIHFQTAADAVCTRRGDECDDGGLGANGNGFAAGNYLSLIAKINIVPLPRVSAKSSLSSFIEELSPEDYDDDDDDYENNAVEVKDNDTNEANEANADTNVRNILMSAKNNRAMVPPSIFDKPAVRKIPVKTSIAYNGDSILPVRINRSHVERRMPRFARIKPMVLNAGKRDISTAQVNGLRVTIERLNSSTNQFLEALAAYLAGRPKPKKGTKSSMRQVNHNNHINANAMNATVNGID